MCARYLTFNNVNKKKSNKKSASSKIKLESTVDLYEKLTFVAAVPTGSGNILIFNPFGDPHRTVILKPPIRFPLVVDVLNRKPSEVLKQYIE